MVNFLTQIFCLLTEARHNVKLFPAVKVYGKTFYDKKRIGHFYVYPQIMDEYLPKKFGRDLTDDQKDSLFEKGDPKEGFIYFDDQGKIRFLTRDESRERFGIDVSEQL